MRYLVKVDELKLKIDYYKKLLNNLRESIDQLKAEKAELMWEGQAHNAFIIYYDKHIEELNRISLSISLLINFLSLYCDRYGYEYLRLKNKLDSMAEWRDENGNN